MITRNFVQNAVLVKLFYYIEYFSKLEMFKTKKSLFSLAFSTYSTSAKTTELFNITGH